MRKAFQRYAARVVPIILFAALLYGPSPALATPIPSSFGLLGSTITNSATPSVVIGNVGATTTLTGFTPGIYPNGTVYAEGDATAIAAYNAFVTAFTAARLLPSTYSFVDGFGLTVDRTFDGNNVYTFPTPAISTATGHNLIFDAHDDPNAVFVIRTDGAFTVNGVLTFTLQNLAQANNIFWIIGTDATISIGDSPAINFYGNILAGDTFTMSAGSGGSGVSAGTINGCVFAVNANTLAGLTTINGCSGTVGIPDSVPEPGSLGLVGLGCLLGILAWRRFRVSL